MTWVKLDDSFLSHPKVLAAGKDGRALLIAGLCYSAKNLTDGLVVDAALPMLAGAVDVKAKPTAAHLVSLDIWHREGHSCDSCDPVPSGHHLIHDYLEYQLTREQVEAERAAGAERQRRSRESRRDKRRDTDMTDGATDGVTDDVSNGRASPDPVPYPEENLSNQNPLQPSADARRTSGQPVDSLTAEAAKLDLDSTDGSPDARAIRAIDWLASERTDAAKNVRNRERYHAAAVAELRAQHWPRALANARSGWTPRDIACRIENSAHRPRRRGSGSAA